MSYRMDPIEREIAKAKFAEHCRQQHAAEEAARRRTGADHEAFAEARRSKRPGDMFTAEAFPVTPAPTPPKADHDLGTRDQFAAGFSSPPQEDQHPSVLDQLLAYGERMAAQQAPEAPAAAPTPVVEPSPMERRAEAGEPQQGQPGTAEQLQLPMTTTALFAQLEEKVATVTSAPVLPPDAQLRQAFRELPGSQRQAIAAQIESQDFGFPGYLGKYPPDYASVLVGDALARRFEDARRLQPDLSPADLLQQMITAAQG